MSREVKYDPYLHYQLKQVGGKIHLISYGKFDCPDMKGRCDKMNPELFPTGGWELKDSAFEAEFDDGDRVTFRTEGNEFSCTLELSQCSEEIHCGDDFIYVVNGFWD